MIDREERGRRVRDLREQYARANPVTCGVCHGAHAVLFMAQKQCWNCDGAGKYPKHSRLAPWERCDDSDREWLCTVGVALTHDGLEMAARVADEYAVRATTETDKLRGYEAFGAIIRLMMSNYFASAIRALAGGQ